MCFWYAFLFDASLFFLVKRVLWLSQPREF
ncbi:MAG: sortase B protein-sorting domain-containing protein [Vibrionaceae bacterium]